MEVPRNWMRTHACRIQTLYILRILIAVALECQLGAFLPKMEYLVHAQPCKNKKKKRLNTAADASDGKSPPVWRASCPAALAEVPLIVLANAAIA
jgi:hypothetical protein